MGHSQNTSDPATRFQIRSTASGTSNPDSMQNLNTAVLPNGAFCFVTDTETLYYLDKLTSEAGGIAPSSGPGKWRVMSVSEAASGVAMVASNGFNSFAVDGNWHPTTSNAVVLDIVSDPEWALTPTGCILTYSGPARKFLVTLNASARVGDATAARDVFLGIGHNADLTGAPAEATSGEIDQVIPTAGVDYNIGTSRLVSMATGDTLTPKMAGPAAATSLTAGLRLCVTPA